MFIDLNRKARWPTRKASGFSMLELLLSLGIFAIIGGALFTVLDASLRTTNDLQDMQRYTRQVAAFTELCRKGLNTLPPDATLSSPVSEEEHGQEIIFRNAPSLFAWGATPMNYGTTTLAVRPQEDGLFSLSLSRSDFKLPEEEAEAVGQAPVVPELEADEQGRYWLPLMGDIEWARWRFYNPVRKEWEEAWPHARRPSLMELSLLLPGDTIPYRAVFNIASTSVGATPATPGNQPAERGRRPR